MKLVVLVDNNTYIDQYYLGEPAVSYYIEDEEDHILFDTGYSDVFMKNAKTIGVDLEQIQTMVISHGHNDHTGGLSSFLDRATKNKPLIVAHPLAFEPKQYQDQLICSPVSREEVEKACKLRLSKEPVAISKNITFLGEIPLSFDFEARRQIGERREGNCWCHDFVEDDSAIVYKGKVGLVIITGCSHSGICNIIEYAKSVCGDDRVASVIGGFHLFRQDERTQKTIDYLERLHMKVSYPCHCTSFEVRAAMNQKFPVREVGVGLELIFD